MNLTIRCLLITVCLFQVEYIFSQKQSKDLVKVEVPEFTLSEKTNKVVYTGVIELEGDPTSLYTKSLAWMKEYYRNPTDVIREKVPATKLVAKHRIAAERGHFSSN